MTERWGMVVDVNRCVGCQTCTIACKHWNDTQPGVQWRQVLDVETGTFPDVERVFLVVGCQHCAEPPCVPVCPTGATKQRDDGLVTMDYDTCIGCAYCAVACPYQARTIVHDHKWYYGRETPQEEHVRHDERKGVAQKCTFCVDKVDEAKQRDLTPGVDPEVTPACAASCIASAIHFGDFNDPDSNVSRLTREKEHFQMHAELGTDPQVKYLYSTPAIPGRATQPDEWDDERLSDPENALTGGRQTFWDWRAAMNWCFGGLASGFAVTAWALYALGAVPVTGLAAANVVAAVLMAVGLFCVWLKIGRRFRAWRAVLRPQTSWMTRELYAAAVFYPFVLLGLVLPGPAVFTIAALAAAAFLVCQARILFLVRGIPAWRAPLVPWMIAATGLLEGGGGFLVYDTIAAQALSVGATVWLAAALAVLCAVNAGLWLAYVRGAKDAGIPPLAREVLRRTMRQALTLGHGVAGAGLALAAALIAAGVVDPAGALAGMALCLFGLLAVAGGVRWKYALVVEAGYQQGFALARMPQRGGGRHAAPPLGRSGRAQAPNVA